jgi:fructose-1,6-bisphosphatase II
VRTSTASAPSLTLTATWRGVSGSRSIQIWPRDVADEQRVAADHRPRLAAPRAIDEHERGVLRAVAGRVQRAHSHVAELELPAVVEGRVVVLGFGQTVDVDRRSRGDGEPAVARDMIGMRMGFEDVLDAYAHVAGHFEVDIVSKRGSTTAAVPARSSPTKYDAQPRSSWMIWRKIILATIYARDHEGFISISLRERPNISLEGKDTAREDQVMPLVEVSVGAAVSTAPQLPASLEGLALNAVRAAALAAANFAGRGDGKAADAAATEAMRDVLGNASGVGTVVIGEGEKDNAPMLFNGERLGSGDGPRFDIAVDPVECTDLCAAGLPGSLTTIAMAGDGCLWSPGPGHYMDKLVVGPAARDAIDLRDEPERNVERVAAQLGKPIDQMRVLVLDKPRHLELAARLREMGVRVIMPSAGDVAGAMFALLPGTGVDMLMGIGGTPEGIMAACAVKVIGGGMQTRLAPQRENEAAAIAAAGISTDEILEAEDLVRGPAIFAACGITGGTMLSAPRLTAGWISTQSLIVRPGSVRRIVESTPHQNRSDVKHAARDHATAAR